MMVALYDGRSVQVWDMWALDESTPPKDTDLGGKDDLTIVSSTPLPNKGFNVTFTRPLVTNDIYDKALTTGMNLSFCWGTYEKEAFEQHSDNGDGSITFGLSYKDSTLTTSSSSSNPYESHGKTMTSLWGILAPLALILARYFRYTIWWFWVHITLGLAVIVGTLYSAFVTYADNKSVYSELTDDETIHSRLGLTIFSFVAMLGALGLISAWDMWRGHRVYKINVERRAHGILGLALVIGGFINCFKGWDLNGDDWGKNFIIICTGVLGGLIVLFEIRQQIADNFPYSRFDIRRRLRKEMTHIEILNAVFRDKKKYAFYEKYVLDLKGFVNLHPGGSFMIKDAYGEDIGKYLIGCSSYGYNYNPYVHSLKALDMVRRLAIGMVKFPSDILQYKNKDKPEFKVITWTLVAKQEIANHVYMFQLTSQEVIIQKEHFPIYAIGKHFRADVHIHYNKVSRYYSMMFVDLPTWKQQTLERQIDISINQEPKSGELEPLQSNILNLIVKIYPRGILSQYLNNLPIGQTLQLEGPFGPGLALTPDFSGPCAAFTAGTGLIPFLDLVYRMWEWERGIGNKQDISLFLYVSFRSIKDSFAIDILKASAVSIPNLKVHIRIDDSPENQGKICKEKLIEIDVGAMERVWICGPSGFNRMLCDMVLEEKVPRERIFIL